MVLNLREKGNGRRDGSSGVTEGRRLKMTPDLSGWGSAVISRAICAPISSANLRNAGIS